MNYKGKKIHPDYYSRIVNLFDPDLERSLCKEAMKGIVKNSKCYTILQY